MAHENKAECELVRPIKRQENQLSGQGLVKTSFSSTGEKRLKRRQQWIRMAVASGSHLAAPTGVRLVGRPEINVGPA